MNVPDNRMSLEMRMQQLLRCAGLTPIDFLGKKRLGRQQSVANDISGRSPARQRHK
jgi:hypothetical protein